LYFIYYNCRNTQTNFNTSSTITLTRNRTTDGQNIFVPKLSNEILYRHFFRLHLHFWYRRQDIRNDSSFLSLAVSYETKHYSCITSLLSCLSTGVYWFSG
jgi:hypothetical protein